MGPDDSTPEKFDLYFDGVKISEIAFMDNRIAVYADTETGAALTKAYIESYSCLTSRKTYRSKLFRCGTRKRFMKLLMSTGLSRNAARIWARCTQTATAQRTMNGYRDAWTRYIAGMVYPQPHKTSW